MKKLLGQYLRRLTDLTSRNRSLLLLRLTKQNDLDLFQLGDGLGQTGFEVFKKLVAGDDEIPLCPITDSRDHGSNALSNKLRQIERRDRFIAEERGTRDLYISWGFLTGAFSDGQPVRGPLVFFPVNLERKGNSWLLSLRVGESISFNKSLLQAYSHYQGLEITDKMYERDLSALDNDVQVFRTELYQELKKYNLEINYNPETFVDRLQPFKDQSKADFVKSVRPGEITLMPQAVLGFFPQAGSFLLPDYEQMMSDGQVTDMETLLRGGKSTEEDGGGKKVREEEMLTPFRLDMAQEEALKAIKSGMSMMVKGPPGTGKSQLICNLVADFTARGKNVLVVCEKRAALDVVHARLTSKGLGDFAGLVHDHKDDRGRLFGQISSQADRLDEYRTANGRLDTVVVEREFLMASREIDRLTEHLEEFRQALYGNGDCGLSPKELYLSTDLGLAKVNLLQEYHEFRPGEISAFTDRLALLFRLALPLEKPGHLWSARRSFAGFGLSDLENLKGAVRDTAHFQKTINKEIKELLGADLDLKEAEWVLSRKEQLTQLLKLLSSEQTLIFFREALGHKTESLWLDNRERVIMQCFDGTPPEAELDIQEVSRVRAAIDHFLRTRGNPVAWLKWQFSKEKLNLDYALSLNNLPKGRSGVRELRERIDQRLNLEHNLTSLKARTHLKDLPNRVDKIALRLWFHHQREAFRAKLIYDSLRSLVQYLPMKHGSHADLVSLTEKLLDILSGISERKEGWLRHLSAVQVSHLLENPPTATAMEESLTRDFDLMVSYDTAKAGLSPVEMEVTKRLLTLLPEHGIDGTLAIFSNSLKLAWLDQIEAKNPVLKTVSHAELDFHADLLKEKIKLKQQLSHQTVLIRLRERTYDGVSYNRLQNMVTYRELTHQVRKKRKLWPLRKIMASYAQEVFDLVPCWLASPETVSAVFDTGTSFDLVIFDEASQAFVEKALPSIYRARQTVVVGDGHQLRPNDLYQVRTDESDMGDDIDTEAQSLLELGEFHLPSKMLTGHYRSEAMELIDFSNRHFYKGRLRMVPSFQNYNAEIPAIRHISVKEGIWEDQRNVIEAEKVVELLAECMLADPTLSLGVVTMNRPQQQLILDLLDENENLSALRDAPEPLFVKNIENAQGDERDIIILSTGYAPDAEGKMRYSFGSLNGTHGANRLNVAITRARKRMILVTSLEPGQLEVGHLRHEGPQLLMDFIAYCKEVSEGGDMPKPMDNERQGAGWYLSRKLASDHAETEVEDSATSLPFADLTIVDGGKVSSLVLTDDSLLYQAASVKDNLALLPMELSQKGWPFARRWSRDWWLATGQRDDTP